MTSSEYRNTVYWTLQAHTPANETDLLITARRIFNNLGVPFPQGTLADAVQILSSGDYMGWSICNADLAQQCANFGYPAIAVNENTLSFILPDEHTIAVNSPVAAVDHSIIWNHNTTSSGNPSTQFFVFARLLDNRDVSSENQVAYSSRNNDILVAAAAATTCSSSCQVACQSGCQKSCQSCNTCQDACETSCQDTCESTCQVGCEVACQSCNTCQDACETSCQTTCQINCQTGCEVACQSYCQINCQTGCQVSCQSCNTCQSSCQLSCQSCNACQSTCELNCQAGCQISCQSTCESVCQTGQTYTVSYNLNGGSGSVPESQTVSTGQNVTLATLQHPRDCYKLDHTFDGWNTNSSGTGTQYHQGENVMFSADTVLYAKFTDVTPS